MPARRALLSAAPVLVLGTLSASAQDPAIDELHGVVTARTFARFADFLADRLDRVVGLEVSVRPDGGVLRAEVSDGRLVAYVPRRADAEYDAEVVALSGFRREGGGYALGGFFLVRSGGMHQGILSYALQPVDEARARPGLVRRVELR